MMAARPRRVELQADEPGRVVFHEHLNVVDLRGPQPMQHDAARTMALVLLDIEKRLRIARPDDLSGRPDDAIDEVRLALEVADCNGQDLGAEVVGAPREFRMVGRMARGGEMKKRLSPGARIAVDQHRLPAAFAGLAAIDAVLAAGAIARVIGPGPVDLRRLAVVLLEALAHFALELFLQTERRRQNRVGVGVLGLQQRADVGRQPARISQHFTSVVRPNPGVIVDPGNAMRGENRRPDLGAWGREQGFVIRPANRFGSRAGHRGGVRAKRATARKAAGT